jgi:hypothetical protein
MSPSLLYFILKCFGLSDELSMITNMEQENLGNKLLVDDLTTRIEQLKSEKSDLENKLGMSIGERDGLKKILLTTERKDWWSIVISVGCVVFMISILVGIIFYGNDSGDYFKPVMNAIEKGVKNNNSTVTSASKLINDSIEIKDIQEANINNTVDLIEKSNKK